MIIIVGSGGGGTQRLNILLFPFFVCSIRCHVRCSLMKCPPKCHEEQKIIKLFIVVGMFSRSFVRSLSGLQLDSYRWNKQSNKNMPRGLGAYHIARARSTNIRFRRLAHKFAVRVNALHTPKVRPSHSRLERCKARSSSMEMHLCAGDRDSDSARVIESHKILLLFLLLPCAIIIIGIFLDCTFQFFFVFIECSDCCDRTDYVLTLLSVFSAVISPISFNSISRCFVFRSNGTNGTVVAMSDCSSHSVPSQNKCTVTHAMCARSDSRFSRPFYSISLKFYAKF